MWFFYFQHFWVCLSSLYFFLPTFSLLFARIGLHAILQNINGGFFILKIVIINILSFLISRRAKTMNIFLLKIVFSQFVCVCAILEWFCTALFWRKNVLLLAFKISHKICFKIILHFTFKYCFCTTIFWICFHFFNFQQFSSPFVTHWDGGNFYHSRYLKTFLVQFYFMSAVSPCSFNLCCYWPNWKKVGHTTQKTETKLNGSIFVTMVMIWRNIFEEIFLI